MVLHASTTPESEVSIKVLCLLCSQRYTAVQIKNRSKNTSVIKVATMEVQMVLHTPVIVWHWSIHCPSLSAMFNSLHSSTNQELFEKYLCSQSSHYENTDRGGWFSVMQRKPHVQPPNQHFSLLAKMNRTQRRTLGSPWRMYWTYRGMQKCTSWAEVALNSEKISSP